MIDKEVGGLVCKIAQNTVEHFAKDPNPPSIRFFGSLGKSVYTREVPKSNVYDLDIDIIGSEPQQRRTVNFYIKEAEGYSGSSNIIIEAKEIGGVVKPVPHPSKRKLFLHLMPTDEQSFETIPKYVKCGMLKYGTQIIGELPSVAYIERIGLNDVLVEPERRIKQIVGTAKGKDAINTIFHKGKRIEAPVQTNPNSLENLSYSVRNNAANIMAALQPYITPLHFDISPKIFRDFRSFFKSHPWRNLPLEIDSLTKKERKGHSVNITGLKEETLNFLAYNDQMIRNMIG